MALVQAIVDWIESETKYSKEMAILVSGPDSFGGCSPPNIGGSIPDVFGRNGTLNHAIIGEAKTSGDIETQRSRKQFSEYLQYLASHERSLLIVAVPWHCTNQVRSLLRSIQRKTNTEQVQIKVLEKLPG